MYVWKNWRNILVCLVFANTLDRRVDFRFLVGSQLGLGFCLWSWKNQGERPRPWGRSFSETQRRAIGTLYHGKANMKYYSHHAVGNLRGTVA